MIKASLRAGKSRSLSRVMEDTKERYSEGRERTMAMHSKSLSRESIEKALERRFLTSCIAFSILDVRDGRDSSGSLVIERRELYALNQVDGRFWTCIASSLIHMALGSSKTSSILCFWSSSRPKKMMPAADCWSLIQSRKFGSSVAGLTSRPLTIAHTFFCMSNAFMLSFQDA